MNVPDRVVRVLKIEFFQRYRFNLKRASGYFSVTSANKVPLWGNKLAVRSGFRRNAGNFRGLPATVCLISATVSVYKLTDQGLLAGAVVMVHGCGKKQWVAPVLEKIEMSKTAILCPATGSFDKQNAANETGKCGHGPSS